ncbi:MAG: hypothetical protein ACKV2U_02960 [Bryobacteraceae bacterium]
MARTILLVLVNATLCFSVVVAVPNLRQIGSQSSDVIVGTIASMNVTQSTTQPVPTALVSVDARVIRSLAGILPPARRVRLTWAQSGTATRVASELLKGDIGLWFLKRDGSNSWSVLPFVATPARFLDDVRVPLSRWQLSPGYEYRRDASLADKALLELLSAANGDVGSRYSYVYWGAFDEQNPAIMERFYRRLLASNSPLKNGPALAGLIRLGRSDALVTVERKAHTLTPYLDQLSFSIGAYYRNGDALSVAVLGKLATGASTNRALRKAAAQVLAFIHNQRSAPFLVGLMESGDVDLETLGTGGLAMFANGVGVISNGAPAHSPPSSHPGPYRSEETIQRFTLDVDKFKGGRAANLAFWRTWWRRHRSKILAPSE